MYHFTFFLKAMLGLHCCMGFSLVAVSKGTLCCDVWFLTVMTPLVAEQQLQLPGSRAHGLSSCGAWAGLVAPQHVGSSQIRDQIQVDSLLMSHQGSPHFTFLAVIWKCCFLYTLANKVCYNFLCLSIQKKKVWYYDILFLSTYRPNSELRSEYISTEGSIVSLSHCSKY